MKRHSGWKTGATIGTVVFAFATAHQMHAAQNTSTQTSAAAQQVTVTGCIAREADYRKSVDAGRGGVASTGVGTGNEFVLTNAMTGAGAGASTTPGASTSTAGAGGASPTGTAGRTAAAMAYELTGPNEGKAQAFVGKRVEITGMLKGGDTAAGGATGGPTGNVPLSQDLKLRELEISSIRESTTGTCTAIP